MQVFICDKSMSKSAKILDPKRLNKQIVEAYQIITDRLPNLHHPAYLFWKDYKDVLRQYLFYLCEEYTRRHKKVHKCSSECMRPTMDDLSFIPCFNLLFLSHRVNLLRKDFDWYSMFFSVDKPLYEYPTGYFWITPYGRDSRRDTMNWLNF